MGTALIILVLLALCGFIAYIGDLLGRRLGKKRLSIFGLRPKHTAIVLTVVTGVVIAGVTFGAAMLIVPWFRTAVIQGERLATVNRSLRRQNERIHEDNGSLEARNQSLQGDNTRLADANAKLTGDNSQLQAKNQDLAAKNEGLNKQNSDLQRQQVALNAQLTRLHTQIGTLGTQVASLSRQKDVLTTRKYVFRRGEKIVAWPYVPAAAPEDQLERIVDAVIYSAESRAREATRLGPKAQALALIGAQGDSSGTLTHAAVRASAVAKARSMGDMPPLFRVVAAENCVEGQVVRARLECTPNAIAYHAGDVVASVTVPAGLTQGQVLERLWKFLPNIRAHAIAAPRQMDLPPDGEELKWGSSDQLIQLAAQLSQMPHAVMVEARAQQDTRRTGPLNVDIRQAPSTAALR